MTAVPHTNLDPFYQGFSAIIETVPTFEAGSQLSSLAGALLVARVGNGVNVAVGAVTVIGKRVNIVFASGDLSVGRWSGQLATQYDVIATFSFDVVAVV
jgi:hypothetical protein